TIPFKITGGGRNRKYNFYDCSTGLKTMAEGNVKEITFVTGNQNKLREVQQILGSDFPHKLVAKAADLPEYQGEADTVSELKCPEGLHKMLLGFDDHTAYAMATLAYTDGSGEVKLFKGITEGSIVSPRGASGFGWDACFMPKGYDITYGEMPSEEKNTISHRKRAVEAMRDYFRK
ncbi:unnamed protein product, partial [Allacma fusca]